MTRGCGDTRHPRAAITGGDPPPWPTAISDDSGQAISDDPVQAISDDSGQVASVAKEDMQDLWPAISDDSGHH